MQVEVITVGDEILSGNITDTNFAWLGDQLWTNGLELHWHTSVGDEEPEISRALMASIGRSDAVIVTGGLGPTIDDITVEVAAKAFGLRMVKNNLALEAIRERFRKIGRETGGDSPRGMTPNNEKQALFPEGSLMIPNRIGTAPGCQVYYQNTHYFFLPGVPREMKQQFEEYVLPYLRSLDPEKNEFRQKKLRCFGLPEATIGQKLEGLPLVGLDLAYRVSFPEVFLKISARGPDVRRLEERIHKAEAEIRKRLGEVVYAEGEESLPALLGRLLAERKRTVAVAESCTGGRLASLLTDVPGSSRYFDRGVVTYSNQSKTDLLKVPPAVLKKYGAVSSETAAAMAKGIRKIAKTDFGISVTGIAGSLEGLASPPPPAKPDGASPSTPLLGLQGGKPVGTCYIAVDSKGGTQERKFHFPTNREWFKLVASYSAMDLLRKKILNRQEGL